MAINHKPKTSLLIGGMGDTLNISTKMMISGYVGRLCISIVVLSSVLPCLRVAVGALVVPTSKHQHQLIRCSRSYWYLQAGLALPPTRSIQQLYAVSKKEEQSYWKLPRLYVMSNNKMQENARIPLSQDRYTT